MQRCATIAFLLLLAVRGCVPGTGLVRVEAGQADAAEGVDDPRVERPGKRRHARRACRLGGQVRELLPLEEPVPADGRDVYLRHLSAIRCG